MGKQRHVAVEAPTADVDDGQGGTGWSGPLLDRAQKILQNLEGRGPAVPFAPGWAWGPEGAKASSPNHEANDWSQEAVRATLGGDPADKERAFRVLLDEYIPREIGPGEKAVGLWSSEQLCPDNHTHQHLPGCSLARVAAVKSGHLQLLERTGELLRAVARTLVTVASPAPDFYVCSAGLRSKGQPIFWWGTAWLRALHGIDPPMPGWERFGRPSLWDDRAAASIRAIRWLRSQPNGLAGADREAPGSVKLKWPVDIYRGPDRHLVIFPQPKGGPGKEVADWVEMPWGLRDYAVTMKAAKYGLNWKTPPPKPPAGAELIRFPAMWGNG